MPKVFQGQWCQSLESPVAYEHFTGQCGEPMMITANVIGTGDPSEYSCSLVRLTPQVPSNRAHECRATFRCRHPDRKSTTEQLLDRFLSRFQRHHVHEPSGCN